MKDERCLRQNRLWATPRVGQWSLVWVIVGCLLLLLCGVWVFTSHPAMHHLFKFPYTHSVTPNFTPTKVGDKMINPIDGAEVVLIPAGEFLMGSSADDPEASDDEKPKHKVYLDALGGQSVWLFGYGGERGSMVRGLVWEGFLPEFTVM